MPGPSNRSRVRSQRALAAPWGRRRLRTPPTLVGPRRAAVPATTPRRRAVHKHVQVREYVRDLLEGAEPGTPAPVRARAGAPLRRRPDDRAPGARRAGRRGSARAHPRPGHLRRQQPARARSPRLTGFTEEMRRAGCTPGSRTPARPDGVRRARGGPGAGDRRGRPGDPLAAAAQRRRCSDVRRGRLPRRRAACPGCSSTCPSRSTTSSSAATSRPPGARTPSTPASPPSPRPSCSASPPATRCSGWPGAPSPSRSPSRSRARPTAPTASPCGCRLHAAHAARSRRSPVTHRRRLARDCCSLRVPGAGWAGPRRCSTTTTSGAWLVRRTPTWPPPAARPVARRPRCRRTRMPPRCWRTAPAVEVRGRRGLGRGHGRTRCGPGCATLRRDGPCPGAGGRAGHARRPARRRRRGDDRAWPRAWAGRRRPRRRPRSARRTTAAPVTRSLLGRDHWAPLIEDAARATSGRSAYLTVVGRAP